MDSFCSITGARTIYLKYNPDATILEWTKCFQWLGDTTMSYIFPTNDGGYVMGGSYNSAPWGIFICKYDSENNQVWHHAYSKGNGLQFASMVSCNDGGYIIGGGSFYTDSNVSIHYGSSLNADMFVMKVDSSGNKIWSKIIGGSDDDYVYKIVLGPQNGCYVVGSTLSNDYDCIGNHGIRDA